jgi:putative chitinase
MTRARIFAEIRTTRGRGFNNDEVRDVDAVLDRLGIARDGDTAPAERETLTLRHPTSLAAPAAFYDALRGFSGPLNNKQVEGFNALLKAMGAASWPLSWTAYGLATAWWETARTMQPVREAYWLSEDWRKKNLRYWPHYGRGYVQITWPENYARADKELGLGGKLVANLDLALDPQIAADILVKGMGAGWFAGDAAGRHTVGRHLPKAGKATDTQYREARRIINGVDKRVEIAAVARQIEGALEKGLWR